MKNFLKHLNPFILPIEPILQALITAGATPYLVGGCVRDMVLEAPLKDLDIELHGITLPKAEQVLSAFGSVIVVGKQFGVLRLTDYDIDWSLPRADSIGRKPEVLIDPSLGIVTACRRRDLTMNAMAIDLREMLEKQTVTITDPFGGLDDLQQKQLRAVDETLFIQDPLRFFRVMQFIGRFDMQPDQALNNLCATMSLADQTTGAPLALERITEEIKKLLCKSKQPSLGFRWLAKIGRIKQLFPALSALQDTPQRQDFHPEGDVFEHSMQSLDAAACFANLGLIPENDTQQKTLIMFASLCHDLGKATTTTADLKAHGHDEAGVPLTQALMQTLTNDQGLTNAVKILVRHHLAPFALLAQQSSLKAYKRLAAKLAPSVTMRQLGLVALADRQGRNGHGQTPLSSSCLDLFNDFIAQCDKAAVTHKPEEAVLKGRDLLDAVPAGPKLGTLLQKAYDIQIDEGITDATTLRQRVLGKKKS